MDRIELLIIASIIIFVAAGYVVYMFVRDHLQARGYFRPKPKDIRPDRK